MLAELTDEQTLDITYKQISQSLNYPNWNNIIKTIDIDDY